MDNLDRTKAPEIYELTGKKLPEVKRQTLQNGVELVTLNQGEQPVNRLSVVWPVGDADVDVPENLAVLSPTIIEGTANRSGAEITEMLEYYGAWLKLSSSPHTTTLTLHTLNTTAKDVIPLASELIAGATYPQEAVERIRARQAAMIEIDRRKVSSKANLLGKEMLYGEGHPMARRLRTEVIAAVDSDSLKETHRRILTGVKPTVYLAGLVTPSLESVVADMAGSITFGAPDSFERNVVAMPAHCVSETRRDPDETSMQTAVNLIIPTIGRFHEDYEKLRFATFALGGYFGSRLMSNIREEKGYTYGISASLSAGLEGGSVRISCQTDKRHTEAVLKEIDYEIERLASAAPDEVEMAIVKHTIMSGLTSMLDSPFSVMDYHTMADAMGLQSDYYARQLEALRRFDGSTAREMAVKYLAGSVRLCALGG